MGNEGVVAVERALGLLDCFRPGQERLTLAEFSGLVPLHKTTIYRLLNSLVRTGYVVRHTDGVYTLGSRLLYLGRVYERSFQIGDLVMPLLQALSQATGETASYYVESAGQRLCLFRVQPREGLHQHVQAGSLMPFDDSSTGQVFTRWFCHEGAGSRAGARAKPVFTSGVRDPFTASLSIPVFATEDQFSGALTLSGLTERLKTSRSKLAPQLLAQADVLSARLGASAACRKQVYGVAVK